jgi:hypothetical protein
VRLRRHGTAAAAAAVLCCLLAACGGGGRLPAASRASGPPRVTAQWLRAQRGYDDGGCAFRLLDAAGRPLADWGGITVQREPQPGGGAGYLVSAQGPAPDDLFLYVAYPSASLSADSAALDPARQAAYAMLAMPRRIEDVLVVGLTRLAARGTPAPPGPLLRVSFVPGRDTPFRMASAANTDAASAVELTLTPSGTTQATLAWEERDIGDYNNNGLVEIADISPLGQLFKQTRATAPDPQRFTLVDGDANGEVNLADLKAISANYQHGIDGYTVYRAVGADPAPGDFAPLGQPTLERSSVFAATPPDQQQHRLQYSYAVNEPTGQYSYLVRAWSSDGSAGPASNTVSFKAQPGNQPPQWVTTVGITQLDALQGGLRLHFGQAVDPEGESVSYLLQYVPGAGPVGGAGTVEQTLDPAVTAGSPPYSYDLLGLASGTEYTLLLKAVDPEGQRSTNSLPSSATVPGLAIIAEPWGAWRGGPARSGSNSSCIVREPVVPGWTQPLTAGAGAPVGPLVSSSGWALVQDATGVKRFNLGDGAPAGATLTLPADALSPAALAGSRFLAGADKGATLLDLPGGAQTPLDSPDQRGLAGGPLLLGDYLFGLDTAGQAYSQFLLGGDVNWARPPAGSATASTAPSSDGVALYTALDDGTLHKYALLDGVDGGSGPLGAAPAGGALACDTLGGRLYAATATERIASFQLGDLSAGWTLPLAAGETGPCAPVVAHQFAPALVISAARTAAGAARIVACDPQTGAVVWDVAYPGLAPLSVSAGNARVFVQAKADADDGDLLVLHPEDGSLLQQETGQPPTGELALGPQNIVAVSTSGALHLVGFDESPPLPLAWQGATGIKSLTPVGNDGADVTWDPATAPDGLVVRYAVFYSALPAPGPGGPPAFDAPYDRTTVVSGLSAADGAAGYHLGLTPGVRYTVAVRAYYGRWGENAVTDGNTAWLAATMAWYQQPPLDLGTAPPPGGTQLPDGLAFQMQGVLDSSGLVHLVYNDTTDAHLTHVYQDGSGGWNVESSNIGAYTASDFAPCWAGGELYLAIANSGVRLLERTGTDVWSATAFSSQTITNPQVSLVLADPPPPTGQGVLAYTQFAGGIFPQEIGQYNVVRTDALGAWQTSVALDPDSYAGRDLSAAFDPGGAYLCAMQRGYNYAPNRITPENGELYFAADDGVGGYTHTLVDAGDNPRSDGGDTDSSDVGKRVQLALDSAGQPHLAYLDLNASASAPLGELKYASYDGSIWHIETVYSFDLTFQSFASMQYTWGELSLGLTPSGSPQGADLPVIGMLARRTATNVLNQEHEAYPLVWEGLAGGGWRAEQLDDALDVFPNDREPCVLLLTPTAWQYFVCTRRAVNDGGARRIAYYRRGL